MPRDEATLLDILGAARAALELKGSAEKGALVAKGGIEPP
jgi:hypothetical protein